MKRSEAIKLAKKLQADDETDSDVLDHLQDPSEIPDFDNMSNADLAEYLRDAVDDDSEIIDDGTRVSA